MFHYHVVLQVIAVGVKNAPDHGNKPFRRVLLGFSAAISKDFSPIPRSRPTSKRNVSTGYLLSSGRTQSGKSDCAACAVAIAANTISKQTKILFIC